MLNAVTEPNHSALKDAVLPVLDQPIKLSIFEGPLDLLLFLIRKNEIDIYDIPIETVTRQYLEIIYGMDRLDLEVAGEFFVMASTLMYIKSRMLLPKQEQSDQADDIEDTLDPRWELIEQLLQYKKIKEASASLEELIAKKQEYIVREGTVEAVPLEDRPLKSIEKMELWAVFSNCLRRLAERMVHGQIHAEQVTVSERMEAVLSYMNEKPSFLFSEVVPEGSSLYFLIATFLATLELCRLKKLKLEQTVLFDDIVCTIWEDGVMVDQ